MDHDTPVFAANSIETWWRKMGRQHYRRGRPLEDYETVVNLIGATTTAKGLKARMDRRHYRTGVNVSAEGMNQLHLVRSRLHGEWNYVLKPEMANQFLSGPSPRP